MVSYYGAELEALYAVLRELGVEVIDVAERGGGVTLAQAGLDDVDVCIAVLPPETVADLMAASTVYVEIGVIAARGLPVLIVAPPPQRSLPALSGLPVVSTSMADVGVLRLHVGLFVQSVSENVEWPTEGRPMIVPLGVAAEHRARLREIRGSPSARRGDEFERLVADLLRDAGAHVQTVTDDVLGEATAEVEVDMAAFVPGEELRLGTFLIVVKRGELDAATSRVAQEQLSRRVRQVDVGLGVFVYDRAGPNVEEIRAPMVFSISIDQLMDELEQRPLNELLVEARNRAVHGM